MALALLPFSHMTRLNLKQLDTFPHALRLTWQRLLLVALGRAAGFMLALNLSLPVS